MPNFPIFLEILNRLQKTDIVWSSRNVFTEKRKFNDYGSITRKQW